MKDETIRICRDSGPFFDERDVPVRTVIEGILSTPGDDGTLLEKVLINLLDRIEALEAGTFTGADPADPNDLVSASLIVAENGAAWTCALCGMSGVGGRHECRSE